MKKELILTAEELVLRYQKEVKTVRIVRWVMLTAYILLLLLTAANITLPRAVIAVILFILVMKVLQGAETQQFVELQQVLNQKCDAVKYTEIMERLLEATGKEQSAIRMSYAKGLYYAGRFAEAQEALNSFYLQRPSVGAAVLYRSIAFGCCMEQEDVDGARREREEVAQLLGRVKPAERGPAHAQLQIMDAELALAEERYEEFFPQQTQVLQAAQVPLQRVSADYRLALGKLVMGEDAEARQLLEQVVENGGTCFMAAEAANLLEEFALPEKAAEDEA